MIASLGSWIDTIWMGILVGTPLIFALAVAGSVITTVAGVLMHAIVNDEAVDVSWENISCQTLEIVGIFFTFLSQAMHFSPDQPAYKNTSPHPNPILFVPGYQMNRWSLAPLQYYLYRRGYHNSWAINNPILKDDVFVFVENLKDKIDALHEQSGQPIHLIAHSMGGLICRHYIEKYGTEKVASTISLATPYRGTKTYRLGRGKVGRQFKPGSEVCSITTAPPVPHLIVRSTRDWVVVPFSNTALDDANDLVITNAGHLGVLVSVPVFQHIHRFLDELSERIESTTIEDQSSHG